MIKYVGNVTKNAEELKKLLDEGYIYLTEMGYALTEDEDISTDDTVIENALCILYEEN